VTVDEYGEDMAHIGWHRPVPLVGTKLYTKVEAEEDAFVIGKLSRLLAEIAVVVKGPEPANGVWSYHDLPEIVRQLKATSAQPGDAGRVLDAEDWNVLARLKAALPDVGLNGWIRGVAVLEKLLAAAPPQPESRSRMRRVAHEKGEPVPRFDGGFDRTASHSADSYVEFQPERPASGPVQADGREVDEAMVERACAAFDNNSWSPAGRQCMRAALTAALAHGGREVGNG